MSDQRRGFWARRRIERVMQAEKRRLHLDQEMVRRINELPDGWHISSSGNYVRTHLGLRTTVYRHDTQGWCFVRSPVIDNGRSFSRRGFNTREEAMRAAWKFPGDVS